MENRKVRLLFFSVLQDIAGGERLEFELPSDPCDVGEVLAELFERFAGLRAWEDRLLVAVNCAYARREDLVRAGDEVAIMPPVQGG